MTNLYIGSNTLYQAGSGNIVGATSIVLTSFADIYGNVLTMADFGSLGFITCEPDTTNQEFMTFTGVTANANLTYTLTGIKTALAKSPYTQTSGALRQHSGGTKVVISDSPAFWNTFANLNNVSAFTVSPTVPTGGTGTQAANATDIANAVTGASGTSTTLINGTVKISVNPVSPTSPIVVGQNDPKFVDYFEETGAANVYVLTPSPSIGAYADGQHFSFRAANGNTTTSTLNINGLGAKVIYKETGTVVLASGDIATGQNVEVVYENVTDSFRMLSQVGNAPLTIIPATLNFGDGSDGNVTIASGTTTITRDMYYNNLTIQTGGVLNPSGYRVFVMGTLTFQGTGIIARNGTNGGNGGNGGNGAAGTPGAAGAAGVAGAALAAGSIAGGVAGGTGAVGLIGVQGNGGSGNNGLAATPSNLTSAIGSTSGAGAAGGAGGTGFNGVSGGTAGGASAAATVTNPLIMPRIPQWAINLHYFSNTTFAFMNGSAQAPGGSSGGSGGGGNQGTGDSGGGSGGGGAGGSSGGIVMVAAYSVVSITNNVIQALGGTGGKGGNGGNGSASNGGGGGGSAGGTGGTGGVVVVIYHTWLGTALTTAAVAGGTGGSLGTGGTAGTSGTNGSSGSTGTTGTNGVIYSIQV